MLILPEQFFRSRYHLVRLEAESFLEFFQRCRCSKCFHADHASPLSDVSFPSERRRLLTARRAVTCGGKNRNTGTSCSEFFILSTCRTHRRCFEWIYRAWR